MSTVYSARQIHRTREMFTQLSAAMRGARLYPVAHPAVQTLIADLQKTLDMYFAEGSDIALTFNEGEILLGEYVLTEESVLFDQLVRDMHQLGVDSLTILRGLEEDELGSLIGLLVTDPEVLAEHGGIVEMARAAGLPHARFAAVTVMLEGHDEDVLGGLSSRAAARAAYDRALEALRELEQSLGRGTTGAASTAGVRAVVQSLIDNVLGNRPAIMELTGLKDHDEYTFYHSVNVAVLSLGLGSAITEDRRFLSGLGAGSLLHDLGKLQVGLDMLNKTATLDPEEWDLMQEHPVFGAEIAARMAGLDRSAIVIIYEHHQRHDGSGYPSAPPDHRQSLASRIVSIADTYDAMTSVRSYSGARTPDEAMGVLTREAGISFDRRLVALFIRIMGVYPPRSIVRLTSGELAVVAEADPLDPARPIVHVFADGSGSVLGEPRRVTLSEPSWAGLEVAACVDAVSAGIDVEDYL